MDQIKAFVNEIAELTKPDNIQYIDGSDKEYKALVDQMIEAGTILEVVDPRFPDSYSAQSDPSDVARVEDRTFICAETEEKAGPKRITGLTRKKCTRHSMSFLMVAWKGARCM